jgi:hypothetical protein
MAHLLSNLAHAGVLMDENFILKVGSRIVRGSVAVVS